MEFSKRVPVAGQGECDKGHLPFGDKSKLPFRVGNGYDVHRIGEGLEMWLGGVKIESSCGFVAHSDGDVALHALCDALLGSLALGDIGHHFPDNSDEWAGVDSKKLLGIVVSKVHESGYLVGNVDITIALQRPKIARYIPAMKAAISPILGVPESCVSIKATTTEGMGFVGRCEGCQVWATATVLRAD